ncbi:MAG: SLC13 family permease, partial [Ignavibacteria bacterium]|nr:SLC13 family permease [Ignavibacteria bacterium]
RLLVPMAAVSAFLNNTPLMAMLIPAVKEWCRQHRFPSSKLLLPVNYAVIVGGTCTLIGTSTNLVVHGLLLERGYPGFSFFELGLVGVPMAVAGIGALVVVLHRFLPKRKEVTESLGESSREFVVEMKVEADYEQAGKSVEEAGLRNLRGLFLFQIERAGMPVAPVHPEERILSGDRLFFTGIPSSIMDLQKQRGLVAARDSRFNIKDYDSNEFKTYEVVISPASPLVGRTVKETGFRGTYDAVILAIHRSGERIDKKIGDVRFKPGDTLLLLSDRDFHNRWYHTGEFLLVSQTVVKPSKRRVQAMISVGIGVAMVLAATLEVVPMVVAAATAAVLLVVTRSVTSQEAFASIDFNVLLTIAGSFGIARALESVGIAGEIGKSMVGLASPMGDVATVAALYFATVLVTEFVSNNAAAAIMFPIGLSVAGQVGMPVMAAVYAVTLGASSGFATPIGYQTSLMVQGPGGYRFRDYLTVGIPMDLIVGVTAVVMIWLVLL